LTNLFYNQLTEFIFIHLLALCQGILVTRYNWKVNYTRKINHFFVFFSPYMIGWFIPYKETPASQILISVVGISTLFIYIKPIRNNVRVVQLMFAAFDRPEDRPHTLKWLFTQYLGTYLVALPLWLWFKHINHTEAIPIIILINAIGDGLAEPIGVTWGKHKYKTYALFTHTRFTRSYEGSSCIFITAIIAIVVYSSNFTQPQFITALITVPVISTLAEAKAPHTWDSPFIFFFTGATLACIYLI
jgi:dolichol kinase